jgi:hypothetical protein
VSVWSVHNELAFSAQYGLVEFYSIEAVLSFFSLRERTSAHAATRRMDRCSDSVGRLVRREKNVYPVIAYSTFYQFQIYRSCQHAPRTSS